MAMPITKFLPGGTDTWARIISGWRVKPRGRCVVENYHFTKTRKGVSIKSQLIILLIAQAFFSSYLFRSQLFSNVPFVGHLLYPLLLKGGSFSLFKNQFSSSASPLESSIA